MDKFFKLLKRQSSLLGRSNRDLGTWYTWVFFEGLFLLDGLSVTLNDLLLRVAVDSHMIEVHLLWWILQVRRHDTFLEIGHQDWCTVVDLMQGVRRIWSPSPISTCTVTSTTNVRVVSWLLIDHVSWNYSYRPLWCHLLIVVAPMSMFLLVGAKVFFLVVSGRVEIVIVMDMINLTAGLKLLSEALHLVS